MPTFCKVICVLFMLIRLSVQQDIKGNTYEYVSDTYAWMSGATGYATSASYEFLTSATGIAEKCPFVDDITDALNAR